MNEENSKQKRIYKEVPIIYHKTMSIQMSIPETITEQFVKDNFESCITSKGAYSITSCLRKMGYLPLHHYAEDLKGKGIYCKTTKYEGKVRNVLQYVHDKWGKNGDDGDDGDDLSDYSSDDELKEEAISIQRPQQPQRSSPIPSPRPSPRPSPNETERGEMFSFMDQTLGNFFNRTSLSNSPTMGIDMIFVPVPNEEDEPEQTPSDRLKIDDYEYITNAHDTGIFEDCKSNDDLYNIDKCIKKMFGVGSYDMYKKHLLTGDIHTKDVSDIHLWTAMTIVLKYHRQRYGTDRKVVLGSKENITVIREEYEKKISDLNQAHGEELRELSQQLQEKRTELEELKQGISALLFR